LLAETSFWCHETSFLRTEASFHRAQTSILLSESSFRHTGTFLDFNETLLTVAEILLAASAMAGGGIFDFRFAILD
jgi:hypothetical protein